MQYNATENHQHHKLSTSLDNRALLSSHQGRDVVLAIDLTGSVRLNDEGRLRLKQIIQDSLHPGDAVYVVPFASTVNPLQPQVDCLSADAAMPFSGKPADIDRILQTLPLFVGWVEPRNPTSLELRLSFGIN